MKLDLDEITSKHGDEIVAKLKNTMLAGAIVLGSIAGISGAGVAVPDASAAQFNMNNIEFIGNNDLEEVFMKTDGEYGDSDIFNLKGDTVLPAVFHIKIDKDNLGSHTGLIDENHLRITDSFEIDEEAMKNQLRQEANQIGFEKEVLGVKISTKLNGDQIDAYVDKHMDSAKSYVDNLNKNGLVVEFENAAELLAYGAIDPIIDTEAFNFSSPLYSNDPILDIDTGEALNHTPKLATDFVYTRTMETLLDNTVPIQAAINGDVGYNSDKALSVTELVAEFDDLSNALVKSDAEIEQKLLQPNDMH